MARQWNGMEHRWGERVPVNLPVQVTAQPVEGIDAFMMNLSLSGALMKTGFDLRLHSLIDIIITLPPPSPQPQVVRAHVSRRVKQDFAVEWCEFAPAVIRDLLRSTSIRPPV
jgi:hypothetical protein